MLPWLYSRFKIGTAGKYFDFIMSAEIILGLAIIFLKRFPYVRAINETACPEKSVLYNAIDQLPFHYFK